MIPLISAGQFGLSGNRPNPYTYDAYAGGWDGGPDLDYWWKMDTVFSSGNAANYGSAGTAALAQLGTLTGTTYEVAGITQNTADAKCASLDGAQTTWFNANSVRIDGTTPFTAGGWFNTASQTSGQQLFKSNGGGEQGRWRGVDIYHEQGADYLVIVVGDNAGQHYRWKSPAGSFPLSSTNFVALYVSPTTDPATITVKLYINGDQKTLTYTTGSATSIAWPVTNSNPSGRNGIQFGGNGDTYGGKTKGTFDETFLHFAEITAAQVSRMYSLGTA